jgi:Kef-type K+ transport system membrane component KefB/nucleotide-binding universal stress UspA family protein
MNFQPGFLASFIVILVTARLLGEIAQRLGQPPVVGQLAAGILLGPTGLGALWPQAQHFVFPPDPTQRAILEGFAEFGILLLLVLSGMEADLLLLRKIGRPAVAVSLSGVAVPFLCGAALGFALPPALLPAGARTLPTALFLGVAMSISSIKIVATVVRDMKFERRDLGQILVASSIIEDSLGWILIAVILGLLGAGGFSFDRLAWTIGGVAAFLGASLTLGRRFVGDAVRIVNDTFAGEFMVLTFIVAFAGALALLTKAIGLQTVLGAFVAGVIIGESPILTKAIEAQLRAMVSAVFAPVFFALAGLNADLTGLASTEVLALTAAVVLVASLGKFIGAFVGGALGRLSGAESLALAIGMNARGSTEVIVASIGLSSGALTPKLYAMIVTMAVLTTSAMPPGLRWALARIPLRPGERERLAREAFEAKGFVANMERFLVAASDHPNGRLASWLVGLLAASRGQPATVLHVDSEGIGPRRQASAIMASDVRAGADHARSSRPDEAAEIPDVTVKERSERAAAEDALAAEAPNGYDFLVMGLDPAESPGGGFSPAVATAARSFDGPCAVAVARGSHERDPAEIPSRILVPISGAAAARRAAEVAIELARAARGELTILLIEQATSGIVQRRLARRHRDAALKEVSEIADQRGQAVRLRIRASGARANAILRQADRDRATLIVLGVSIRPSEAMLFGETANQLLATSPKSLLFVVS